MYNVYTMNMIKEFRRKALAKVNLGLDVLGKREDGYHELRMIMQTVSVFDRIYMKRTAAPGIRIRTNVGFLPVNENNLMYKAADLLMQRFQIGEGVFMDLDKHIPVAAGLAGGSSDAAAVLTGMNRMFELGLSQQELMDLGVRIGADVPYCIMQGTALAEGIGEKLTPLPSPPECRIVLAKPGIHVSTKFVYGNLKVDQISRHPDIDGQVEALKKGDLKMLADLMGNVLEQVTVSEYPKIGAIKEQMLEGGALGAMMSGSGPTVFGLFEDEKKAEQVYRQLREDPLIKQAFLAGWAP